MCPLPQPKPYGGNKMKDLNTQPIFDVDELEPLQDWFERKGGRVFCSTEHGNWFLKKHRFELMRSGNFFPGTESVPHKVGPDFGKAIIQIMQRKANIIGRINMSQRNKALLHTIEQTRELLSCSRSTVYKLVNSSELTMIKVGRRSLITDETIRVLVDRKVTEAQNRARLHDHVCVNKRRIKPQST
jgi:excisionase family DNA binding protein